MPPIKTAYRLGAGLCVLFFALFAQTAFAAGATNTTNAVNSKYQQDRKFCMSGQSNQDKKTCLREAGAAREAAKKGKLSEGAVSFEQDALARCKVLPDADRADCVRRVNGGGTVSGSVKSGGIIRETTTTIVGSPATSPSPSSTMPQTPQGNIP